MFSARFLPLLGGCDALCARHLMETTRSVSFTSPRCKNFGSNSADVSPTTSRVLIRKNEIDVFGEADAPTASFTQSRAGVFLRLAEMR